MNGYKRHGSGYGRYGEGVIMPSQLQGGKETDDQFANPLLKVSITPAIPKPTTEVDIMGKKYGQEHIEKVAELWNKGGYRKCDIRRELGIPGAGTLYELIDRAREQGLIEGDNPVEEATNVNKPDTIPVGAIAEVRKVYAESLEVQADFVDQAVKKVEIAPAEKPLEVQADIVETPETQADVVDEPEPQPGAEIFGTMKEFGDLIQGLEDMLLSAKQHRSAAQQVYVVMGLKSRDIVEFIYQQAIDDISEYVPEEETA